MDILFYVHSVLFNGFLSLWIDLLNLEMHKWVEVVFLGVTKRRWLIPFNIDAILLVFWNGALHEHTLHLEERIFIGDHALVSSPSLQLISLLLVLNLLELVLARCGHRLYKDCLR